MRRYTSRKWQDDLMIKFFRGTRRVGGGVGGGMILRDLRI